MPLPRLKLKRWTGGPPEAKSLGPDEPVLWLGGGDFLRPLRTTLGERAWSPELTAVTVPGPTPRSTFTFNPDAHPPLRWGRVEADVRTLVRVSGKPDALGAVVFDEVFGGLGQQAARTLLSQVAEVVLEGGRWLLLEPNGRYLPEVIRHLRRDDSQRSEARGTVRSGEELRRLLEVAGFGIEEAWGIPGGRLRARLPSEGGHAWILLRGRRY
ncbi:MAG: hypothetical protein GY898_16515 [Proteobacteria bacterium]|nr:hypothetical protein [Pseudomonadota bacterium]